MINNARNHSVLTSSCRLGKAINGEFAAIRKSLLNGFSFCRPVYTVLKE